MTVKARYSFSGSFRRAQSGNFIISTAIATLVMAFVALGYATLSSDTLKTTNGTIMGNQLQAVATALNDYISENAATLDSTDASRVVTGVANKFSPTVAELRAKRYLEDGFLDAPTFGGAYVTAIEKDIPACVTGTGCRYVGIVYFSQAVTTERGILDLKVLQAAANASRTSQVGFSLPGNPAIIRGPGWERANPLGIVSGVILARSNALAPEESSSNCPKYSESLLVDCTSRTQLINSTGQQNTVIGIEALESNIDGSRNSAVGAQVLEANTSGGYNVGVGSFALQKNTTGSRNVGIGDGALFGNTKGNDNIAIGVDSQRNSGINSSAAPEGNVSIGYGALKDNVSGRWNIALGVDALSQNTNGDKNVVFGYSTFRRNVSGSDNIAVGENTLFYNSTGNNNIGMGQSALWTNTSGSGNIGLGQLALHGNNTGVNNIAIGFSAVRSNSSGSDNIGIGNGALYGYGAGVNASNNIAIGFNSLSGAVSAYSNIALGYRALLAHSSGVQSIAIGHEAGVNTNSSWSTSVGAGSAASGSYSTAIGYNAKANQNNSTAIGNGATATAANSIRLGDEYITSITGKVNFTSSSDARLKSHIVSERNGLDFINRLRPVTYEFKSTPGKRHSGFIAQEVEAVAPEFTGISKPRTDSDFYGLTYTDLIGPLTKAIQELDGKVNSLSKSDPSDHKLYLLYLGLLGLFVWNCVLQVRLSSVVRPKTAAAGS